MFRILVLTLTIAPCLCGMGKREKKPEPSPIDRLIADSSLEPLGSSPGSAFDAAGRYSELYRDLRANQKGDIVTIIVSERASAISKGTTASNRGSGVNAKVTAAGGALPPAGVLPNLASAESKWELKGEGETTRETSLSTRLSARVVHVLPNGNLVIEGSRIVGVNSERQRVVVRGIVRWNDLAQNNTVASDRISDLEIQIDGRGVVQDAIRRPNILYRILLGILPF